MSLPLLLRGVPTLSAPVVAASTSRSNASATTAIADKPSGVAVGDLMIVHIAAAASSGAEGYDLAGWQRLNFSDDRVSAASNADASITSLWRVADGTEGSTFTFAGGATTTTFVITLRITGADLHHPIGPHSPRIEGGSTTGTVLTAESLIPDFAVGLLVCTWGAEYASTTTFTIPGSMTKIEGNNAGLSMALGYETTSGYTATGTRSAIASQSDRIRNANSYMVRPAGATIPIVQDTTSRANTTLSTSLTGDVPTGTVSGNLLVAKVNAHSSEAITPPAGWTTLHTGSWNYDSVRKGAIGIYWKISDGTEGATQVWTSVGTRLSGVQMLRITNFDSADPIGHSAIRALPENGSFSDDAFPTTYADRDRALSIYGMLVGGSLSNFDIVGGSLNLRERFDTGSGNDPEQLIFTKLWLDRGIHYPQYAETFPGEGFWTVVTINPDATAPSAALGHEFYDYRQAVEVVSPWKAGSGAAATYATPSAMVAIGNALDQGTVKTTVVVTTTVAVATGEQIIAGYIVHNSSNSLVSVTDNVGNTYAIDYTYNDVLRDHHFVSCLDVKVPMPIGTQITFTCNAATSGDKVAWIAKTSGLAHFDGKDVIIEGGATNSQSTYSLGPTAAPSQPAGLAVSVIWRDESSNPNHSPDAPWTEVIDVLLGGTGYYLMSWRTISNLSPVTATGTWTGGAGDWGGLVGVYKAREITPAASSPTLDAQIGQARVEALHKWAPGPGGGAIEHPIVVGAPVHQNSAPLSQVVTTTSLPVAAGNSVVVAAYCNGIVSSFTSVVDSLGNAYTIDVQTVIGPSRVILASRHNVAAMPSGVVFTATLAADVNAQKALTVISVESSSVLSLDAGQTATDGSTSAQTAWDVGPLGPFSQPNQIVFGVVANASTAVNNPDAGWTELVDSQGGTRSIAVQYRITESPFAVTPSGTMNSVAHSEVAASYKPTQSYVGSSPTLNAELGQQCVEALVYQAGTETLYGRVGSIQSEGLLTGLTTEGRVGALDIQVLMNVNGLEAGDIVVNPDYPPGPYATLPILPTLYKYALANSDTMEIIGELTGARARRLNLVLNKPGASSFQIPITDFMAKEIVPLRTCLIVYKLGIAKWSGPVWSMQESYSAQGKNMVVNCVGWKELLNRRLIRERKLYLADAFTGGEITFDLLDYVNGISPTGIAKGVALDTQVRNRTYERKHVFGRAIDELTEIENGYDWVVDPLTKELNIYDSQISSPIHQDRTDVVFGFNWGPENLAQFDRNTSVDSLVNSMIVSGKNGSFGPYEDATSIAYWKMFEEDVSLGDVANQEILSAYAQAEILFRKDPRVLYSILPFPASHEVSARPRPLVDYGVGDRVYLTARYGDVLEVEDQPARVFGMDINIEDNGAERVNSLTLSQS